MLAEAADRERRAVECKRRNDCVDTRAVGQARIDHRRRFIDASADARHDAIDNKHEMLVVLEDDVGDMQLAVLFDVNLVVAVDEDVGDLVVAKQRLEWAQAEQLVFEFLDQPAAVDVGQQAAVFVKNLVDRGGDFGGDHRGLEGLELGDIDSLEQFVVNLDLQAARAVRDCVLAPPHRRADERAAGAGGVLRACPLARIRQPVGQSHLALPL